MRVFRRKDAPLQFKNPVYDDTATPKHKRQAETETSKRNHANERGFPSTLTTRGQATVTLVKHHSHNNTPTNAQDDDNFENPEYATVNVDIDEEPSYSVVGRKVGTGSSRGYDTLVRSGDHDSKLEFSGTLDRTGSYSELLTSSKS